MSPIHTLFQGIKKESMGITFLRIQNEVDKNLAQTIIRNIYCVVNPSE